MVDELYRRANAGRWQLSSDDFAAALEAGVKKAFSAATPSARDVEHYLKTLRLEDLALACACAAGHEAAWDHFVLEYRPVLYRAADALDPTGGARELADSLYADLFGLENEASDEASRPGRTGAGRRSLFRYFHGRSSLATWLRAVLAQRLVDRARAHARVAPLPDEEPAAPANDASDLDRNRYLALMHDAFRAAMAALEPRDRLRLRYYYVQGSTLAETGRLLKEHEASVSRHLSSARRTLRTDVERRLSEAGLGPEDIARCFESVTDDAGPLDLDRLLGAAAGARNPGPDVQSTEGSTGSGKAMFVQNVIRRVRR
jgi:RNA polymerase sigma factor (sigma-70 family)